MPWHAGRSQGMAYRSKFSPCNMWDGSQVNRHLYQQSYLSTSFLITHAPFCLRANVLLPCQVLVDYRLPKADIHSTIQQALYLMLKMEVNNKHCLYSHKTINPAWRTGSNQTELFFTSKVSSRQPMCHLCPLSRAWTFRLLHSNLANAYLLINDGCR